MRGAGGLPWISAERRVVEGVEAIVVGEGDVSRMVQQQRQHVIALLGYGVVERRVALRVLRQR